MNPRRLGFAVLITAGLWVLSLLVYRLALRTWFMMDDFAWLGLPEDSRIYGFWTVLFRPQAQGTVRVFSERLFFLGLTPAFGMSALPFKLVVFATQFANLTLLAIVGRKLTGSPLAGIVAAVAFLFNSALSSPMSWLSAYNEVLWTLVLLSAFLFLLLWIETGKKRFYFLQWVVFLFGFGVLELNVVYPLIALSYAVLLSRRHVAWLLPMLIPSAVFAVYHLAFVPHTDSLIYRFFFDAEMFRTLARYAAWALGPKRDLVAPEWGVPLLAFKGLLALVLAAFAWVAGGRKALFLAGWFLLIIAPVVPLKNHMSEYYLTAAIIGPCLLGGWAFASATRHSIVYATLAVVLLAAYCAGHYAQMQKSIGWRAEHSQRMRVLLTGVARIHRSDPREMVLISGVDRNLYAAGFHDDPFRLYGIRSAYLVPGSEAHVRAGGETRSLDRYTITQGIAARALDAGRAYVVEFREHGVADITAAYRAALSGAGSDELVNVGLEASAPNLGSGWFPIENRFRWMGARATIRISPGKPGMRELVVTGYSPAPVVAAGPLQLGFTANGHKLGTREVSRADQPFEFVFPLGAAAGATTFDIEVAVDRPTRLADGREVGMIFGTFAIR